MNNEAVPRADQGDASGTTPTQSADDGAKAVEAKPTPPAPARKRTRGQPNTPGNGVVQQLLDHVKDMTGSKIRTQRAAGAATLAVLLVLVLAVAVSVVLVAVNAVVTLAIGGAAIALVTTVAKRFGGK